MAQSFVQMKSFHILCENELILQSSLWVNSWQNPSCEWMHGIILCVNKHSQVLSVVNSLQNPPCDENFTILSVSELITQSPLWQYSLDKIPCVNEFIPKSSVWEKSLNNSLSEWTLETSLSLNKLFHNIPCEWIFHNLLCDWMFHNAVCEQTLFPIHWVNKLILQASLSMNSWHSPLFERMHFTVLCVWTLHNPLCNWMFHNLFLSDIFHYSLCEYPDNKSTGEHSVWANIPKYILSEFMIKSCEWTDSAIFHVSESPTVLLWAKNYTKLCVHEHSTYLCISEHSTIYFWIYSFYNCLCYWSLNNIHYTTLYLKDYYKFLYVHGFPETSVWIICVSEHSTVLCVRKHSNILCDSEYSTILNVSKLISQ